MNWQDREAEWDADEARAARLEEPVREQEGPTLQRIAAQSSSIQLRTKRGATGGNTAASSGPDGTGGAGELTAAARRATNQIGRSLSDIESTGLDDTKAARKERAGWVQTSKGSIWVKAASPHHEPNKSAFEGTRDAGKREDEVGCLADPSLVEWLAEPDYLSKDWMVWVDDCLEALQKDGLCSMEPTAEPGDEDAPQPGFTVKPADQRDT